MIVFRQRLGAAAAIAPSHLLLRLPEWMGAGFLFALGAQLSRPGDSFALSRIYDVLARMGSERQWALVALTIATVRFVALILNGFFPLVRRVTPAVRALSAFAGGCVWLALTVGFAMVNTGVVGIVAHAGWGFLDFTYAVLVAHEAATTLAAGSRRSTRVPAPGA